MKTTLLGALLLTQIFNLTTAIASDLQTEDAPQTHTVYVSYKFATDFCHAMNGEAMKKAYSYCAENGYRRDECNIITVGQYDAEMINEPTGQEYADGDMMYYKMLCTYQARFQMVHKTLDKYSVNLDSNYDMYGNFTRVVTKFSLNTNGLANFRMNSVPDAAQYSSQLEFRMKVDPKAIGTTIDLGTICISEFDAGYLPNGTPLSNENFSLIITAAKKHKYFDGCSSKEVPANAKLIINN